MKKLFVLGCFLTSLFFAEQIQAQTGGVTVYEDANYQGSSYTLAVGDYLDSTSFGGIGISSIKIPSGYAVIVYANTRPTSPNPAQGFGEDMISLPMSYGGTSIVIDDNISSIRVMAQ